MDNLDCANAWEVTNCRAKRTGENINIKNFKIPDYGNYEKLAQKSLGHALGPISILFSLGFKSNSLEIKSLLDFFKHYLIARQLSDDAHDWERDLLAWQINPAAALILKKVYKEGIKDTLLVEKNIKKFQKIFWYEVIEDICNIIFKSCEKARNSLKKCEAVVDGSILNGLLAKYEKAAQLALEEKENTIKFLGSL